MRMVSFCTASSCCTVSTCPCVLCSDCVRSYLCRDTLLHLVQLCGESVTAVHRGGNYYQRGGITTAVVINFHLGGNYYHRGGNYYHRGGNDYHRMSYIACPIWATVSRLLSGVKLGSGCRLPLADSEFQDPIQNSRIRFEKRAYTNYYKLRKLIRGTNL